MNPNDEYDILLAIPCYRENERLPPFLGELLEQSSKLAFAVSVLIVDDGSPEPERSRFLEDIETFRVRFPHLSSPIAYLENRGKGYAIRTAWKEAGNARYLAFIDADGSISAQDACAALSDIWKERSDDTLYIATRAHSKSKRVNRSFFRRVVSKLFNLALRWCYHIEIADTQCGFKIAPASFIRSAHSDFRQEGYAFDIELINMAQAQKLEIKEIPVNWEEKSGGKLKPGDGFSLFWDVLMKRI